MARHTASSTIDEKLEILAPADVRVLVRRYRRTKDPRARDLLLRSHYRLIAAIARKHGWARQDVRDLIQAGSLGFLRALEKFDPKRGVLLSTYAVHWIRAYISRFILDNWRLVRIGTTQRQRLLFRRARRDAGADLTPSEQALVRHMMSPETSLDEPISAGDEGIARGRVTLLRAPHEERPDELVEDHELRARLRAAVARFTEGLIGRERAIFEARWLRAEQPTLASLGVELGLSRERVRQLERRLLDRLEIYLDAEVGDLRDVTLHAAA